MKPTRKDRREDFLMILVKPLVKIWMFFDMKTKYHWGNFDRKRKDPYIMLGNHTFMFDIVHIPLKIKKVPFMVASQTLFTKPGLKFLLEKIAHAIPKSKGSADIRTAREMIGAVKRGYPIMIMPEGNTTFRGDTTYIEESTMKLIKKLGIDVVLVLSKGGYLSKPRWATGKRKKRRVDIYYKVAITKEEIKSLSVEEINEIVNRELYNNDYEYQREAMIPHPGKHLAEGLENCLYSCPNCEAINSLETNGNTIKCVECNTEGYIDKYGFIHGFKYDNTVDWDNWQKGFNHKLRQHRLESDADLFFVDEENLTRELIGRVNLVMEENLLRITGEFEEDIPLDEMFNPVLTLRKNWQFTYKGKLYFFRVDKYVSSFLRAAQNKY